MLECWQQAAKIKASVGLWIIVDMVIIGDMMRFRLFELPFVLAQTKKLEKMSLPLAKFSEEFMVIYVQLCTCINVYCHIRAIMHMHKRSNTMPVY